MSGMMASAIDELVAKSAILAPPGSITWFDGTRYDFLSNFHPVPGRIITLPKIAGEDLEAGKPRTYTTTEHAFVAAKTALPNVRKMISNMKAEMAGQAKGIGRTLTLRADWEKIKYEVMQELVLQKFTLDQKLQDQLLATGNVTLFEGNCWHDNIWGGCVCKQCKMSQKQNNLGKTLMRVRVKLQQGRLEL